MPYNVQYLNDLYEDDQSGVNAQAIEAYLNRSEGDGWTLVGIISDHPVWVEDGEASGHVAPMLVLHRPAASEPGEGW
ncbi:hypothetical protein [Nocardioides sp. NPDC004968]|uniref:hypothetical protein n=1 Tax=Nocardioides sp. NPDC004968 TaxID=3155894 RepID=UPI0033AAD030